MNDNKNKPTSASKPTAKPNTPPAKPATSTSKPGVKPSTPSKGK